MVPWNKNKSLSITPPYILRKTLIKNQLDIKGNMLNNIFESRGFTFACIFAEK